MQRRGVGGNRENVKEGFDQVMHRDFYLRLEDELLADTSWNNK
jgi:hypothetical protein